MGVVEVLLLWDQLARQNVNRRAAELSLGHLIHVGDRVIKFVPKGVIPAALPAFMAPANWAAVARLVKLVSPVIVAKRALAGTAVRLLGRGAATLATSPVTAAAATMITPPNALLIAAAGMGVDRLVQVVVVRALRPRAVAPPVPARIASILDGRCLASGTPLRFARCGTAGTEEWRFERVAPRVALTRQAVLGLVHGVDGVRFFAAPPPRRKWNAARPR